MKKHILILLGCFIHCALFAQIDPELLRRPTTAADSLKLNMDAIYDRPMIKAGKVPVSIGGYVEGNYQYLSEDGVSEGHQFQFRRLTLFLASSIAKRL